MPHRRTVLAGLSTLPLAPASANTQGGPTVTYEYQFLLLSGPPAPVFVDHVRTTIRPAVEAGGDAVVGLFTPQLGWASNEAALMIRRRGPIAGPQSPGDLPFDTRLVRSGRRDLLTATARPAGDVRPAPGGIYVHRWFEVATPSVSEFVELSVEGWRDFEARFETRIYGLFTADRSEPDRAADITRMLLVTRYASHAVWEASRDPSTDAMAAFRRRQQLTRSSKAASTLLADIGR